MAARWRQENYFKYAREHFALDVLDSYADRPDDPTRPVPNPAKARALAAVGEDRAAVSAAHAGVADALDTAAAKAGAAPATAAERQSDHRPGRWPNPDRG